MGTRGKWKAALEEAGMHTRALAVYTGVGRYTGMHSSTHGGLTRSGSMFSRLTFHYLNVCICVCLRILCIIIIICRGRKLGSFLSVNMWESGVCAWATLQLFFFLHISACLSSRSSCWWFDSYGRGPAVGVTRILHPFSVSKELTCLFSSLQQAEGPPPLLQSKFTRKWNPLYAKQTMRRK